jgi:CHASE3 domain sensor protein
MIRKAALHVGVPCLLGCIVLNAYLAVAHLRQMEKIAALMLESSKTQATISGVLKDLTDMETSQRGYLLTGDQSYLEPYTAAKDRIGTDFGNLRSELASRPEDQRSLESQLETLAKSKQVEIERTINLRRQGYRHRAFMLVNTNEGKGYMDEARRVVSSLYSAESSDLVRLDSEKSAALKKFLSMTILSNWCVLLSTAGLFAISRYHGRVLADEAVRNRQELAARDAQLAKLTSALAGQARFNITALNTNSRLLLENYGGFLPRQGHEYAEQMKEAATEMERLRLDLVGTGGSDGDWKAA